jgi:hypothetical protein
LLLELWISPFFFRECEDDVMDWHCLNACGQLSETCSSLGHAQTNTLGTTMLLASIKQRKHPIAIMMNSNLFQNDRDMKMACFC